MARERSRARARALQVLYAWESRGDATPRDTLAALSTDRVLAPGVREHLERLIGIVADHRDDIDRALAGALTNWRLERLSAIDRNVLRIGAAELLHPADVPPKVAIREAMRLADRYGSDESARFVNGVLDALMRRKGEVG